MTAIAGKMLVPRSLLEAIVENDPNDDAADGVTVYQVWQKEICDLLTRNNRDQLLIDPLSTRSKEGEKFVGASLLSSLADEMAEAGTLALYAIDTVISSHEGQSEYAELKAAFDALEIALSRFNALKATKDEKS